MELVVPRSQHLAPSLCGLHLAVGPTINHLTFSLGEHKLIKEEGEKQKERKSSSMNWIFFFFFWITLKSAIYPESVASFFTKSRSWEGKDAINADGGGLRGSSSSCFELSL